jgi:hypothetical protein
MLNSKRFRPILIPIASFERPAQRECRRSSHLLDEEPPCLSSRDIAKSPANLDEVQIRDIR